MWGEVNSTVHRGLGVLGCVTNGSVRDLGVLAKGFPILAGKVGPSHAHVHVEEYGMPVDIFGMTVSHGDLIHADCHGAVVIPMELAAKLPAAIDLLALRQLRRHSLSQFAECSQDDRRRHRRRHLHEAQ